MPSERDRDTDEEIEIVIVDEDDIATGYRATELIGSSVANDQGERIGTLEDLIIGRGDMVAFAVLQVGGFLGLGGKLVAVPYASLLIGEEGDASSVVLPGATKDELRALPEFKYDS